MDNSLVHLPPYARIAGEIKRRILRREWRVGEALPPQRQLSVSFGVTTATLNRAIGMLIDEGIVTTSSGHGTFVARLPPAEVAVVAVVPARRGLTIAVLAPTDHDPLAGTGGNDPVTDAVVAGAERVVSAAGGLLRFYRIWHNGLPSLSAAYAAARNDGSEAVIILNVHDYPGLDAGAESVLNGQRTPNGQRTLGIYIPGVPTPLAIPQVGYSHHQAGFLAADHLLAMGYRQLVALRTVDAAWANQRVAGVSAAMHLRAPLDAAVEVLDDAVPVDQSHGLSDAQLAALGDRYLERLRQAPWWDGERRIGVVLSSDRFALALLGAMRRQGVEPGRRLGVVGFDDCSQARLAGLTSMRPPMEALGAFAAEALVRADTSGTAVEVHSTTLLSSVSGRDSTRLG